MCLRVYSGRLGLMDPVQTKDVHSGAYMEEAEVVFYTLNPVIRLMKNLPPPAEVYQLDK